MGFMSGLPPGRHLPGRRRGGATERLGRADNFTWMQKITSFLQSTPKTAKRAPRVDYGPGQHFFNYY
jgi:hypothetical protein